MKKNMLEKKVGMLLVLTLAVSVLGSAGIASSQEENVPENRETADVQITKLPAEGAVTVMPEVAQPVELSSSDVNRITCQGEIKDVVYSREKGITVKFSGRDAFVKFRTGLKDGKTTYSTTPSEIFVVCGDNVYSLIALPKRIPARSIRLSPGKTENIRKNRSLFGALPFEKKILSAIRSLYTEEIPESFTVSTPNRRIDLFRELDLVLARIAVVEGEVSRLRNTGARSLAGTRTGSSLRKGFSSKRNLHRPHRCLPGQARPEKGGDPESLRGRTPPGGTGR